MLNKHNKGLTISLTVLIAIGVLALFLSKSSADPTLPPAVQPETGKSLLAAPAALIIDVPAAMQDRTLGRTDAPVTIIEYASMTCSHCAAFNKDIMPEVKKRLIDTGKAKLIYRDFPLDNVALRAAMMTRCAPADKYFSLIEVVFSNQERWAHAADPLESLAQLGTLAGVDTDLFNACTKNEALETAILDVMKTAQTSQQVKSTPTFIFNNGAETISGVQPVEKFEEIVRKLTKGK